VCCAGYDPTLWRCPITGWPLTIGVTLLGLAYLLVVAVPSVRKKLPFAWEHPLGAYGLFLLVTGNYLGLFFAPGEKFMGDVGRILHVHVPAAWIAMLAFLIAGICAFGSLWSGKRSWDSALEAFAEVGVMEAVLLCILGAIWGRATWETWWTWDPRLTTTAVMLLAFVGLLLLRAVVTDVERRTTWSAVAGILATINVPITYYSVDKAGLHQAASENFQNAESAIDSVLRWVMYYNTAAFLFIMVWFAARRWRLAEVRAEAAMPEALPEVST